MSLLEIFQDLPALHKALKVCFCLSCIFLNFILTNRRCAVPIALVQWSITNVPATAANLERHKAQNEVKIYFKLWTWEETLQEQVVESPYSPVLVVVEQLEGAGKIWADGGQRQQWLLLTQWEQRSQRTDCRIPIVTTHKQHYGSFGRPFVIAQRNILIC